jgi:hypothetical protein
MKTVKEVLNNHFRTYGMTYELRLEDELGAIVKRLEDERDLYRLALERIEAGDTPAHLRDYLTRGLEIRRVK